MDWYIDQMRWQNYDSKPLPFSIPQTKYKAGKNNSVYVRENERWATLDYILAFVASDDPRTKLPLRNGDKVDHIPTHKIILPVDSVEVISNGTIKPQDAHRMLKEIRLQLTPNNQILKGALGQLDILASNQWKRPIYYTSGGFDGSLGLEEYYRNEGLAYRLVPVLTPYESIISLGEIETDTLYDRLLNTFQWGRMNQDDVQLDYYTIRTLSVIRFRSLHTRLAIKLLEEGKREKAVEVLDHCMELSPSHVLPFDQYITGITLPDQKGGVIHYEGIIEAYYLCDEMDKANEILKEHFQTMVNEFSYYNAMKPQHKSSISREINEVLYQIEEMKLLLRRFNQEELMLELGISGESMFSLPG